MVDKGWERAGYAPRQVLMLQRPDDGVKVEVDVPSRVGWKVSIEGQSKVGQICKNLITKYL